MKPNTAVDAYLNNLPEDRKEAMDKLRAACHKQLKGFEETIQSGMIAYVVPKEMYPKGYHCDPKQPLPFMYLASQKAHIAVYHMGVYADQELLKWFTETYAQHSSKKLDMGKSCIRFKKPADIPYSFMEELFGKIDAASWIKLYESAFRK